MLLPKAEIILPHGETRRNSVLIDGANIARIFDCETDVEASTNQTIELADCLIFPGFIDIHNHGANGVDVNGASASHLHAVSKFLATRGVTAWLPTLVPDSAENYRTIVGAIDEAMQAQTDERFLNEKGAGARILGVHYEGVFANEKMCGALRREFFQSFKNSDEIDKLPKLSAPDAIHLTTLAPEIENGIALVKEFVRRNWTVSIGHTRADAETLNEAFAAGARSVTHLFNAMTGVHHRDLGVAGWALTTDDVFCEIIADGIHVAPEMLAFAHKNKTAKRLALVSDSVAPAGLGDGDFRLWNENISVANGKTRNERGSIAGSVITMLDAVKTMRSLGVAVEEVSKMASLTPARMLGVDNVCGSIETGKRADLTAIDAQGNVKLTIVGGRIVEF